MKFNGVIVVALIAALGLFSACGSETTPKDDGTNTEDTTTNDNTTDDNTNTTDNNTTDNNTDTGTDDNNTDIGGTGGDNSTDCAQAGEQCFECYAQADMAGYQAYVDALVQNCLCANECEADCTDACLDPQQMTQGSACEQCFQTAAGNQQSGCVTGFMAECQANQSCITFATNVQNCPQ